MRPFRVPDEAKSGAEAPEKVRQIGVEAPILRSNLGNRCQLSLFERRKFEKNDGKRQNFPLRRALYSRTLCSSVDLEKKPPEGRRNFGRPNEAN